jgi:hypothetical protein
LAPIRKQANKNIRERERKRRAISKTQTHKSRVLLSLKPRKEGSTSDYPL